MRQKKKYLMLDCETATLPFANEIAGDDPERKKRIAIAKPLIYDIGWIITDRLGTIIDSKHFLIAEIFSVPSIFNTAYYADKRPIYLDMLYKKDIRVMPWNDVMEILIKDMKIVDGVGAFNSMFDFKKAIPFTELYIHEVYSPNYFQWEQIQRQSAARIADGERNIPNPEFEADIFRFRGCAYPLFDLWGLATTYLLNNSTYKTQCLKYNMLTASGTYFKTSAESSYRYLQDKYDFDEAHTALDDAIIESYILHKVAQKHAITPGIKYFPFRDLGYTYDYCMRRKVPNMQECTAVFEAMKAYVDAKEEETNYIKGLLKKMDMLLDYMEGR